MFLLVSSKLYKLLFSLLYNETFMFKYFIFTTLYEHSLYLHQERVLSTEAAMFFKVAQTGQTKPFEFL